MQMQLSIVVSLTILFLSASIFGQAPEGWTQTAEADDITGDAKKMRRLGEWVNEARTISALAVSLGTPKDEAELRSYFASIGSGIMRSGTLPLKYEALRTPYPGLLIYGQRESDDGEYFENTYVIVTKQGVIMIKCYTSIGETVLDLSKWGWKGIDEPQHREFSLVAEAGAEAANKNIKKLQDLVKKARAEKKKQEHNNAEMATPRKPSD